MLHVQQQKRFPGDTKKCFCFQIGVDVSSFARVLSICMCFLKIAVRGATVYWSYKAMYCLVAAKV